MVDEVVPGSVAEIANIKKGDRIFSVDNKIIYDVSGFVDSIKSKANTAILIKLFRSGEQLSISLIPRLSRENIKEIGVIGVKIKVSLDKKKMYINYFKINNLEIISKSFYDVLEGIKIVFKSLSHILTGSIDWRLLSGPISIATLSSETITMGLATYLSFLVFLNINVGLLNLLPIPTLDGGLLFFYAIEWILGKPLNKQKMIISQRLGVVILFLVFTLAVYNDIFNFMFN